MAIWDVGDDERTPAVRRMRLGLKDAEQKCLECHDLDNSPDFQEEAPSNGIGSRFEH